MNQNLVTLNHRIFSYEIDCSPRYVELVRSLTGHSKGKDHFRVPDDYPSSVQLESLSRYFDFSTDVRDMMEFRLNQRQRQLIWKAPEGLSPLQVEGVRWMCAGSGVLADQMGVGKTVQTCSLLDIGIFAQSVLIVVTKSTLETWARHLAIWSPKHRVFVLHGTPAQRAKVIEAYDQTEEDKVLLTTHGMVNKHSEYISYGTSNKGSGPDDFLSRTHWDTMVVDEVHKFRDPRGKTYRGLCKIREKAVRAYLLTGTPIEDNPDDMWMCLRLVYPQTFKYRSRFRDRYCFITVDPHGGVTNEGIRPEMQEEWQKIVDNAMLRRMRKQVWPELPEALPTDVRRLPMSAAQVKAYNSMKKEMMADIEGRLLMATDPVTVYQMLDYIATGVPEVGDDGKVVSISPHGSNKLEAILDIAEERAGDPFVVYAPSRKVVDMLFDGLAKAGYSVGRITGKIPAAMRTAYMDMFQEGKLDVMVMTSAGAEGITLTAADLLVYCDLDWSARINQQVADRIDRKGQERPPQRIVLLSEKTIDESRLHTVELKEDKQQAILKDADRFEEIVNGTLTV